MRNHPHVSVGPVARRNGWDVDISQLLAMRLPRIYPARARHSVRADGGQRTVRLIEIDSKTR